MASPKGEVERAKRLLEEARARGKCEDEAKAVGHALEDLASEAGFSAGEASAAGAGIVGMIGGVVIWLLGLISGIGAIVMMAIGLLALLGAGGHNLDRNSGALRKLRRANDDLEECLKRLGYSAAAPVENPPPTSTTASGSHPPVILGIDPKGTSGLKFEPDEENPRRVVVPVGGPYIGPTARVNGRPVNVVYE